MKSLLTLARSLLDDIQRLHPEVKGLGRDYKTIEARFKHEGYGFFAVALPAFGKAFDLSLASGRMSNVTGFASNGRIPRLFSGIVSHVFDPQTGVLREEVKPEYILSIRQLLFFFKKFLPEATREENLTKAAIKDFEDTDRSIHAIPFCMYRKIRRVSQYILSDLDKFDGLICKHGPGAVSEKYTPNQKWKAVHRGLVDFDPVLVGALHDEDFIFDYDDSEEASLTSLPSACARLVTVPKSCIALRTITVEPCLNQYVQQGLNDHLRKTIERCPVVSHSLELDSQTRNQLCALEGSLSGTWSTIDLSSASDLLSQHLVEAVFGCHPQFYGLMQSSRTPAVKLGKSELTLKKYAGMGNATTFPVQSVCYTVLAICSIVPELFGYRDVRDAAKQVRVFGDDIALRTDYFSNFQSWATSCGLKINRSKTFTTGNFRESCGVDAYKGVDVTPCYLRFDPALVGKLPQAFAGLVSTSNQLWLRGYYSCAEAIRTLVDGVHTLPLVHNRSGALGWHSRRNATTYQRWSRTLHRFEVRSYVPTPLRRSDVLSGVPALLKFYRHPQLAEFDEEHRVSTAKHHSMVLRRRWVPSW